MTTASEISALATRIAVEINAVRSEMGGSADLDSVTTSGAYTDNTFGSRADTGGDHELSKLAPQAITVEAEVSSVTTSTVVVPALIAFTHDDGTPVFSTLAPLDVTNENTWVLPDASGVLATEEWVDVNALGTDATLDDIDGGITNLHYTSTDATKLSGIEENATANDTDANLKARANHTGTQTLSTISDVTASAAEVNVLDGITASTAELNTLDGVTATAAEINVVDGLTATTTELNYVDGVTSAIQTQINAKVGSPNTTITGIAYYANVGALPGTGTSGVLYIVDA